MSTPTAECIECHGKGTLSCRSCEGTGQENKSDPQIKYITRWEEILSCRLDLGEEVPWIFRGQPDDEPLETLLGRHCKSFLKDPLKEAPDREELLLREFQRRYHQYTSDIPNDSDILEWFSIMQHYGAPTRLLDFTYSILIAAFFALEKARKMNNTSRKCSIWAINAEWAQEQSECLFKNTLDHQFFDGPITKENALKYKDVFMSKIPKRFASPVNPFRFNERLTIQKGIFMCPGDITVPFEENLKSKSMKGHDSRKNIIKLVITMEKNEWRKALDTKLYEQNITRAVLFPGLEGFATSLKVSPPKRLLQANKSDS